MNLNANVPNALIVVGKLAFCIIALFEGVLLFGLAYYSLRPEQVDLFDEDSPNVLAAVILAAIATVFSLGVLATWVPRLPLRKPLLGISALGIVLFNVVWGLSAL